jgi:hypothetical protein
MLRFFVPGGLTDFSFIKTTLPSSSVATTVEVLGRCALLRHGTITSSRPIDRNVPIKQ